MRLKREYLFNCTVPTLWRCLNEYELLKKWLNGVEEIIAEGDKRGGVGTRSIVRLRQGTQIVSFDCEIIEWEHQGRLGIRMTGNRLSPGSTIDVFYTIAESYEQLGTRLTYELNLPLPGLVLKLLYPIIWLGVNKSIQLSISRLKSLAESIDHQD